MVPDPKDEHQEEKKRGGGTVLGLCGCITGAIKIKPDGLDECPYSKPAKKELKTHLYTYTHQYTHTHIRV